MKKKQKGAEVVVLVVVAIVVAAAAANWLYTTYTQTQWLTELRFYVPPDTKQVISETFFPAHLLA